MDIVIETYLGQHLLTGGIIPQGYNFRDIQDFNDLLEKHFEKRALDITQQVHWGDWRKFENAPYIHHVLAVTLRYAKRFPNEHRGIAAALLHDTVENAYKFIKNLSERIDEYKDLDPGMREPIEFFNHNIPSFDNPNSSLFLEFSRKEYGFVLKRKDDDRAIRTALKEIVDDKDCQKKFTDFVRKKIHQRLHKETALIVRILTREKTETTYLAGFEREDIALGIDPDEIKILQKIAADIKCLDAIHNLSTLNIEKDPKHAARTILRIKDSLNTLKKASAEEDWLNELSEAVTREWNEACKAGKGHILNEVAHERKTKNVRPMQATKAASVSNRRKARRGRSRKKRKHDRHANLG